MKIIGNNRDEIAIHNEWIVLLGGWKYYVDISILLHVHAHEHIHTPIYPVSSHV